MRQQAPARSPLTTIWSMVRFCFGVVVDTLCGEEVVGFAVNSDSCLHGSDDRFGNSRFGPLNKVPRVLELCWRCAAIQ